MTATDAQTVEYPEVKTDLPGPRSAELMARNDAIMYGPYRDHTTVPLYIEHKTDWLIADVDGNTLRRPRLGLGVEPARRDAGAGSAESDRGDAPLRVRDHRLRP